MSCALTQGYTQGCTDSIGGVKAVWFIAHGDVSSVTESSGVVTAISKSAGKVFYKYNLPRNSSSYNDNVSRSIENGTGFFSQELLVVLNKMQANIRNEVLLLSKNVLMAVVEDNNGAYWLLGKGNGLDLTGGGASTGVNPGDRNGYNLTFTGTEKELAPSVDSSVIATLTV